MSSWRTARSLALTLVLAGGLLAGCSDDSGTDPEPSGPEPWLSTTEIDFGTVDVGSSKKETLGIGNEGEGFLFGEIEDPCPGFEITSGAGPFSLGNGDFKMVEIAFAPADSGQFACTLSIGDPEFASVSLEGVGHKTAPTTGTISGLAMLEEGVSGDLRLSRVFLYESKQDLIDSRPARSATTGGAGFQVSFAFGNLEAGEYFLDVWKDTNGSEVLDSGDYYGVYGYYEPAPVTVYPEMSSYVLVRMNRKP